MKTIATSNQDCLFGQLLVNEKLISEHHITDALTLQRKTGQRLGDIFAQWRLITLDQLQAVLHTQHHLRLKQIIDKALMASVLGAVALTAQLETHAAPPLSEPVAQSAPRTHHWNLSDPELSEIAGRSMQNDNSGDWLNSNNVQSSGVAALQTIVNDLLHPKSTQNAGMQLLGDLTKLMVPILMFLSADTAISGVVYNPALPAVVVNQDGSITYNLPTSINQISFNNIRVAGNTSGPSLGSITLNNIHLAGTTLTLKAF